MAFILLESKRDDLLIPYLNILKEKGIEKPLGLFKKDMLTKLSGQASLPNVSLGSNFYLVGAVRYYLNGDLTTDKKAAYLESGDPMSQDNWDVETCRKLNAVINILRNSHIDSVGTEFEQPEDFGTLPIARLFRKYGKKIEQEIGEEESNQVSAKNRVGNGYTFKIIYTFNQAKQFCALTAPGSWCITRQPNWFRDYINSYDIHYVFFLKDGYQSLNRKDFPGPGFTKKKPHDEYGNSMIAMLQSNYNAKPVIITSRWNHGDCSDNTQGTEADRAYTLEEFCQITGVTEEDLQRIYEMWQNGEGKVTDRNENKKFALAAARKVKYAQILINGGEKPSTALSSVGVSVVRTIWGKEGNEAKSVVECSVDGYTFLMDRGKALLETMDTEQTFSLLSDFLGSGDNSQACKNAIAIEREGYTQIYNIRYHEMVSIEGVTKFKRIPESYNYESAAFIEVKNAKAKTALISTTDLRPFRLPNGKSWFLFVRCESHWGEPTDTTIDVSPIRTSSCCMMEIWVSKKKNIFYNLKNGKFYEPDSLLSEEDKTEMLKDYTYNNGNIAFVLNSYCSSRGFFTISPGFLNNGTIIGASFYGRHAYSAVFDNACNRISIDGKNIFKGITMMGPTILSVKIPTNTYGNEKQYYYDTVFGRYIGIGDKPMVFFNNWRTSCGIKDYFYVLNGLTDQYHDDISAIYNSKTGRILENPTKYPSDYGFEKPVFVLNGEMRESLVGVEGYDKIQANPEPYIAIVKSDFDEFSFRRAYWDEHPNATWSELNGVIENERKKHWVIVPIRELRELPNNIPSQKEPAGENFTVNESTVRQLVKAAITELIRQRNDFERI